jgi:hypothetical protein
MRAIQIRAPTFSMITLLGTSKMKSPIERAQGKPIGPCRDVEIPAHRERGEADVDPVDIGQKVAQNVLTHHTTRSSLYLRRQDKTKGAFKRH